MQHQNFTSVKATGSIKDKFRNHPQIEKDVAKVQIHLINSSNK